MFMGSLSGLIISFISTYFIIPIVKFISLKLNLVDKPEKRKQNKKNLVRLGGIGIFIGIYSAFWILLKFNFLEIEKSLWTIIYSAPLFFCLGLIDDIRLISPYLRLGFQFIISIFVWSNGIQINTLTYKLLGEGISIQLNPTISLLVTAIWIVGLINAINWMDGLDGLAAGLISISISGLIIIGILNSSNETIFLLFPILGACLAFLTYNLYPAKILMGDGGSYLLGFFAASLSIYFTNANNLIGFDLPLIQILLLFIVPILDMVVVILSRIKESKSIFLPDRSHIHHRLIDLGFSHKDTVIIIYSISQLFVSISILISLLNFQFALISCSVFIFSLTTYKKFDIKNLLSLKISPRKN